MGPATEATAAVGRSLLDDTSTINNASDADETLTTEDTYPLRHESEMILDRPSEHSGLLTDDDGSCNTWNRETDQQNASVPDGGSSVNTGSTYEETPFLSRVDLRAQKEQHLEDQESEEQKEALRESQSWKSMDGVSGHSKTNDQDQGYALEMIFDTQTIMHETKTRVCDSINNFFNEDAKRKREQSASAAVSSIHKAIHDCGDRIDAILIKLFNVPTGEVESHPSNRVAVNESWTDCKYVLDTVITSESSATRSNVRNTEEKMETSRDTPTVGTFLIPVPFMAEIPFMAESSNVASGSADDEELEQNDNSAIKDDLDEVLAERIDEVASSPWFGISQVEKADAHNFKEYFHPNVIEKRASSSTASSIHSEAKREKTVMESKKEIDTEFVARVLDRFVMTSTNTPKQKPAIHRSPFPLMVLNEKVSGSDVSVSVMHRKQLPDVMGGEPGAQVQQSLNDLSGFDDESIGATSISTLHKKHLVDLINRNRNATNRSDFLDLSDIDLITGKMGNNSRSSDWDRDLTISSLTTSRETGSNAGRSWHNRVRIHSTDVRNAAPERSRYGTVFPEMDEIDLNLNRRRAKLREMMQDLTDKVNVLESREESNDVDTETRNERRTALYLETLPANRSEIEENTIDLTLYDECY